MIKAENGVIIHYNIVVDSCHLVVEAYRLDRVPRPVPCSCCHNTKRQWFRDQQPMWFVICPAFLETSEDDIKLTYNISILPHDAMQALSPEIFNKTKNDTKQQKGKKAKKAKSVSDVPKDCEKLAAHFSKLRWAANTPCMHATVPRTSLPQWFDTGDLDHCKLAWCTIGIP